MATYRPVYTSIWKDPDFEKYKPLMKLIFFYLCTNESTTESGIYPITIKTISNETGIPVRTVAELLSNGLKNIVYDFKNSCVFVKNFLKYNGGGRPDLLEKSIIKNCKIIKTPLWNQFIENYPQYLNCLQTLSEQFINCSLEIEIEDSNSNSNRNSNREDLTPKEKYNYATGMEAERQHNKLKEKRSDVIPDIMKATMEKIKIK